MIEQVEELGAELEPKALAEVRVAGGREVDLCEAWAGECIARNVAVAEDCRGELIS
jgi:hypothetical protein